MVKHNAVLVDVHRRKHWQRNVRAYLNQATRKHRRLLARRAKAAKLSPSPIDRLRPAVHCQTVRYNRRLKVGKGFTLQEVKAAGLTKAFAQSVGVAVDHRRRNRCQESLDLNVARLKAYLSKLVLFPRGKKEVKQSVKGSLPDTPAEQRNAATSQEVRVNELPCQHARILKEPITKEMGLPLHRNEGKRNKPEKEGKKDKK